MTISMMNALTIDVEDYWKIFSRDWLYVDTEPTDAVVRNTNFLLSILDRHGVKCTFFVVGEVAAKFPQLVQEVASCNHEIAAHGYQHFEIYRISRRQFYQEVSDTKKLLEDITGQNVQGHRAPSFSIVPETQWALEVLCEAGFQYDSSIFPFAARRYGWPDFGRDIRKVPLPNGKSIIEVPLSTAWLLGKVLPACGGGYLRHFPIWYTNWAINRIQRLRPVIVYMHPYDFDADPEPGSAQIEAMLANAPKRSKRRHALQLRNRHTMELKLNWLLSNFQFTTIQDVIATRLRDDIQNPV